MATSTLVTVATKEASGYTEMGKIDDTEETSRNVKNSKNGDKYKNWGINLAQVPCV